MMKLYAIVGREGIDRYTHSKSTDEERSSMKSTAKHHFGKMKVQARDIESQIFYCRKKKLQISMKENV